MPAGLDAQTSSLALSSATTVAGTSVSLNLTLTVPASAMPSALQWTIAYPTNLFGPLTLSAGPALTAAGKTLTCASGTGTVNCMATGLNATTIGSGVVAVVTVPVLALATVSSVTLTPTNVMASLPNGSLGSITTTGGLVSIQAATTATISSVSANPTTIVGGNSLSVTVTLSAAAPSTGAAVSLTSSNSAIIPAANVTIAANATSGTFTVSTLAVTANSIVSMTATYNGSSATSSSITVTTAVSQPATGTAAFVTTDTTTAGTWKGVYGSDGYNVLSDSTSYPGYVTVTPAAAAGYTWAISTTDPRAAQKASSTTDRIAGCWYSAGSFTIDLNFNDSNPHKVALYVLDWDNLNRSQTIAVLDANNKVLDTRSVSSFSGGQYLIWNLSGHVILKVTNLNPGANAVVSGVFFGGGTTSTASSGTSQFITTDTTTSGAWKGVYGSDGYSIMADATSAPAYVTPALNTWSFIWSNNSSDTRAVQKSAASDRVAACWCNATNFTIDLAFRDSNPHRVALYMVDYDGWGGGRRQTVKVLDTSGAVLDSRSLSSFSGGQYLVWNLTGHVVLNIVNDNPASNAVISGIFFGGGTTSPAAPVSSGSSQFITADTTTSGSWKGVYGSEGYSITADATSAPAYVTPALNTWSFVWSYNSSDTRAVQKSAASDRVAACWCNATNFTIDLAFRDSNPHRVALYMADYDFGGGGRRQTVQVLDTSGNLLDSRSVSGFSGGQYLVWNLTGHVVLNIINNNVVSNAVVSGIFFGGGTTSIPAPVSSGSGQFITADATTSGSWKGVYGSEGYSITADATSAPAYVTPALNTWSFVWSYNSSDTRAVQKSAPTATDRVAACWCNATNFTIDLAFRDSNPHRVALYMADYDFGGGGRRQTVQVLDTSGAVLDTRSVTNFSGGQYLVWNLTGHVVLNIINNNPASNAVVSAIFFGAGATGPAVSFVKTDLSTSGSWHSVYGADGFNVIGDSTTSYPAYAQVTAGGAGTYVWTSSTTDPRALQKAASLTDRAAGCWFGSTTFTLDVAFTDTASHQVALYLLDWDVLAGGRRETVQVLDTKGNVLDSRDVSNFSNGQYLVWNASGHIVLKIINTNPNSNAVANGLFFR